jgi:hypothetical protein
MSKYPGQIDNSSSLPLAVDNSTPVSASIFNKLREAIIAIELELGIKPSGSNGTVVARFNSIDISLTELKNNSVVLGGDLGNTITTPFVIGLQGRPVSSTIPNYYSYLRWNGVNWSPAAENDFNRDLFWRSDVVAPKLYQLSTLVGNGQPLTIQAQNTSSGIGGKLLLNSGVGTTANGMVQISASDISFNDTAAALTITPVSSGVSSITISNTVTEFDILHNIKSSGVGATFSIFAQSVTSGTGGTLVLCSGAGSAAGDIELQCGGNTNLTISSTASIFSDTNDALTITPVSSGTTTIAAASTVTAFNIGQIPVSSGVGAPLTVSSQNSLATGGALILSSGSGDSECAAGIVFIQTGGITRIETNCNSTFFLDDNSDALTITPHSLGPTSILATETVTEFKIGINDTDAEAGSPTTIFAQHSTSGTGGSLILISGPGQSEELAGNVILQTGFVPRVTISPTSTYFSDASASALVITPVSSGLTSIALNNTVTEFRIEQNDAIGSAGALWQIKGQHGASGHNGGGFILSAGAGGAGTTIGGSLRLEAGKGYGTGTNGNILFDVRGNDNSFTTALTIVPYPTGITTITAANSVTTFNIGQDNNATGSGAPFNIFAQNVNSGTGGNLTLSSGWGNLGNPADGSAGHVAIETGQTPRLIVSSNSSAFLDTSTALTITPVSSGTTTIAAANTVTAFNIGQVLGGSGTGAPLTVSSQNISSGTGGALILSSGSGSSAAGHVFVQTGGITRIETTSVGTYFSDSAIALGITPASSGATFITAASTVTAFNIGQAFGGSGTGAPLIISSQNIPSGVGGSLTLSSGSGNVAGNAGHVFIQTGGTNRIEVTSAATTFSDASASALTITPISSSTTSILASSTVTNFTVGYNGRSSGNGGTTYLSAQHGENTSDPSNGGAVLIISGDGYGSGHGGTIYLLSGDNGVTSGNGGGIYMDLNGGDFSMDHISIDIGPRTFNNYLVIRVNGSLAYIPLYI